MMDTGNWLKAMACAAEEFDVSRLVKLDSLSLQLRP
jgi:hypothetical protein